MLNLQPASSECLHLVQQVREAFRQRVLEKLAGPKSELPQLQRTFRKKIKPDHQDLAGVFQVEVPD